MGASNFKRKDIQVSQRGSLASAQLSRQPLQDLSNARNCSRILTSSSKISRDAYPTLIPPTESCSPKVLANDPELSDPDDDHFIPFARIQRDRPRPHQRTIVDSDDEGTLVPPDAKRRAYEARDSLANPRQPHQASQAAIALPSLPFQDPLAFMRTHSKLGLDKDRLFIPCIVNRPQTRGGLNFQVTFYAARDGNEVRFFGPVYDDTTEAQDWAICALLTEALNRWPATDAISRQAGRPGTSPLGAIILRDAARFSVCPELPIVTLDTTELRRQESKQDENGWAASIRLTVRMIHPETLALQTSKIMVPWGSCEQFIPEPANAVLLRHASTRSAEVPPGWDISPERRESLANKARMSRQLLTEFAKQSPLRTKESIQSFAGIFISDWTLASDNFFKSGHGGEKLRNKIIEKLKAELNISYGCRGLEPPQAVIASDTAATRLLLFKSLHGAPGWSFIDGFTAKTVQCGERLDQVQQVYNRPSFDAVFPFSVGSSGRTTVHTPGNLTVTSQCLNFAKGTSLPITLQTIANFAKEARLLKEVTSTLPQSKSPCDPLQVLKDKLLATVQVQVNVRFKYPRRRALRIGHELEPGQLEYYQQEWRTGLPHPGSPCPDQAVWTIEECSTWRSYDETRIMLIVAEIEDYTHVSLPRGPDNCPYFGHGPPPTDWTWNRVGGLFNARLRGMVRFCNKRWPTTNDSLTLFLECIFQACIRQMVPEGHIQQHLQVKYQELFDLPLVVWRFNPMRFSIAHRIHGTQMRSGWPRTATRLRDRLEAEDEDAPEAKQNNMLVESWFSNSIKSNFAEGNLPANKSPFPRLLAEVQVPKEWADPDSDISAVNWAWEGTLAPSQPIKLDDHSEDEGNLSSDSSD